MKFPERSYGDGPDGSYILARCAFLLLGQKQDFTVYKLRYLEISLYSLALAFG